MVKQIALTIGLIYFWGCSEQTPESPVPEWVSPSTTLRGIEVPVVIHGKQFHPALRISFTDPSRSFLDIGFSARLGDVWLEEVGYVDTTRLEALVPGTLDAGIYPLFLFDPAGRTGELPEAFTVTGCQEDQDCQDPCRIGNTCQAGVCLQQEVNKDSDGDGFMDAICPGGNDCDDDPAGCGSGCFPGNPIPDGCDGFDNDCDDDTDEDGASVNWWDQSWSYRRALLFDNSTQTETLQNFPVLVVLDTQNFDYSKAQPQGVDLRFLDQDGSTQLSYQIEEWNPEGSSFVWVNVPDIEESSSVDFIWMYYGNVNASDVQNPSGVFNNGYLGVWHLSEATGSHLDSTVNGTDCNWDGSGSGSQDATGRIDGADQLDGSRDFIDCGQDVIPSVTGHTITAWVNLDLVSGRSANYQIVCNESTAGPFYKGFSLYVRREDGAIGRWLDSDYIYSPTHRVPSGVWAFIALRGYQDAAMGYIEVSLNGSPWENIFRGDTRNFEIESGTSLILGTWPGAGPNCDTLGIIDEVRISGTSRSSEWIRAQYLSMNQAFIVIGAEQALSACP